MEQKQQFVGFDVSQADRFGMSPRTRPGIHERSQGLLKACTHRTNSVAMS